MMSSFTEEDWTFLSSIRDQLAEDFARQINREIASILARTDISEAEKRDLMRKRSRARDGDFADCFGDWRRSTLFTTALFLRKHGLLSDDQVGGLCAGVAEFIFEHYPRRNA